MWTRLEDSGRKWLRSDEKKRRKSGRLSNFGTVFPTKVKFWVQVHSPETNQRAVELAEEHMAAGSVEDVGEVKKEKGE